MDRSPEEEGSETTQRQLNSYSQRAAELDNERDKYRGAWRDEYGNFGAGGEFDEDTSSPQTLGDQADIDPALHTVVEQREQDDSAPDTLHDQREPKPRGSLAKADYAEREVGVSIDRGPSGDPGSYGEYYTGLGAVAVDENRPGGTGGEFETDDVHGQTEDGESVVTGQEEMGRRNGIAPSQGKYFGGEDHWNDGTVPESDSQAGAGSPDFVMQTRDGDIVVENRESLTHQAEDAIISKFQEMEENANKHAVMSDVGVHQEWVENVREKSTSETGLRQLRGGQKLTPEQGDSLTRDDAISFFESLDEDEVAALDRGMAESMLGLAGRDNVSLDIKLTHGVKDSSTHLSTPDDLIEFADLDTERIAEYEQQASKGDSVFRDGMDRGEFTGVHSYASSSFFVPEHDGWDELNCKPDADVSDIHGVGEAAATRLEKQFGSREITDFADEDPDEIADSVTGIGWLKADALVHYGQEAREAQERIETGAKELADKYDRGEFGESDYRAILEANANMHRNPNDIVSYIDENSGAIPGVKQDIKNLHPGKSSETVQGLITDVKPLDRYDGNQAFVFDIDDGTGETQVTVWKDSVDIPDTISHHKETVSLIDKDEIHETRVAYSDEKKADLSKYPNTPPEEIPDNSDIPEGTTPGMEIKPVWEGDYVRLENVQINDSGRGDQGNPSVSATMWSEMDVVCRTKKDRSEKRAITRHIQRPFEARRSNFFTPTETTIRGDRTPSSEAGWGEIDDGQFKTPGGNNRIREDDEDGLDFTPADDAIDNL